MSALLKIGSVAELTGISPGRIRNLDARGILPSEPPRPNAAAKQWRRWNRQVVEQFISLGGHEENHHLPPVMRIWSRVRQERGCWIWTGRLNSSGYGQICTDAPQRMQATHVAMYEAARGPVPLGLQIDHLCRVRACCNPDHLEAVTPAENLRRGEGWSGRNYRKTHCIHGHAFDEANTYRDRRGRHCRKCHALREARRREGLRRRASP